MSQSFRINTNVGALQAYDALSKLNARAQTAQLRLATQKRINHVADDTSGFNVGKSLDSKIRVMESAQRNVGNVSRNNQVPNLYHLHYFMVSFIGSCIDNEVL